MRFSSSTACVLWGVCIAICATKLAAQTSVSNHAGKPGGATLFPVLLITPDARSGGMAGAGVAVSPDANTPSINPAKLAFAESDYGLAVSYCPWMPNAVSDVGLAYVSSFFRAGQNGSVASSLRFFSAGEIRLTDIGQQDLGTFAPGEYAFDLAYARKFGDQFSLATSLRYISSAFTDVRAMAVDVSTFYKRPAHIMGMEAIVAGGIHIANIGMHVSTTGGLGEEQTLPSAVRIGGASTILFGEYNELTLAADYNTEGWTAAGMEYWCRNRFALRTGYHYGLWDSGQRYFTVGGGLKHQWLQVDFSYLIANTQQNLVANTIRLGLLLNFGHPQ
ncbi:PorV/PorQ family protein [Pedobacter faecalis]|uniref:PorV/PorQ family protein n=1 Tax=Pedobacter faecalis TaxID=3041495 RepID=UPI00254C0611|nr:PorV/PorQ family protein [Pedobacter sp. ELA7]